MQKKDLIIFDLDGTIIDSAPSLHKAVNFMLNKLELEPLDLETVRDFIGNGSAVLVKRALVRDREYQNYDIDEELAKKALDILMQYYGANLTADTILYEGVEETLENLKNKNYKIALATNKPNQFVKEILEHFNIDKYFDYSIGAGVVEHKKPHPQMLLKVCEELKTQPKDAIMVGDTDNDIIAAKNANMDSIALTHGYSHIDVEKLEPTFVCNHFTQINKILL
jgi:phosphoglycolate phosphatase